MFPLCGDAEQDLVGGHRGVGQCREMRSRDPLQCLKLEATAPRVARPRIWQPRSAGEHAPVSGSAISWMRAGGFGAICLHLRGPVCRRIGARAGAPSPGAAPRLWRAPAVVAAAARVSSRSRKAMVPGQAGKKFPAKVPGQAGTTCKSHGALPGGTHGQNRGLPKQTPRLFHVDRSDCFGCSAPLFCGGTAPVR